LADRPRISLLPNPNVVFVVDDDPGMLMSVKRLLRTNGYDTVLFSSAKAFKNQVDFEDACRAVRDVVEIRCGAISGNIKVSFQAARSIG
jgi:FixJ family two-component response regulator